MNKMGIKIDLSAFFQDERQMVYIMVDPNWESVDSLQKRVEYLFEVDSVRFLNSNGYYLPPKESIEIIKFCEGLKAFVPNESLEKRKKKSKKSKIAKMSPEEFESEENLIKAEGAQKQNDIQKKRKYNSLDSTHIATLNHSKRLKSSNVISETLDETKQNDNKCMEITSTSEQMQNTVDVGSSKKKKTKKSKNCDVNDAGNDQRTQSNASTEQHAENPELKEKLVQKDSEQGEEHISNNNTKSSTPSTSIPSSTFLNESELVTQNHSKESPLNSPILNNPFRKTLSKGSHIYFNDSGDIVSTTNKSQSKSNKESKTVVIFRCPLQEVTSNKETQKPRIFRIERKKSSINGKEKQLIDIKESKILTPIPKAFFENKLLLVEKELGNNSMVDENTETNLEHNQEITIISETEAATDSLKEKTVLCVTTEITETKNNIENMDISLDSRIEEKTQVETNTEETTLVEENSNSKLSEKEINQTALDCVNLSIESEEGDTTKDKLSDENSNDSCSDVEEIIDLNETEDNCNSTFNDSPVFLRSSDDYKVDKILPFCNNLSDLPNISDIIVFKMAYANQKHPTDETNFVVGKVEYINKRTKSIKVLILDGFKEICHIDSRFVLNWRDSEDFINYLQVKMCDMIQPKIYLKS